MTRTATLKALLLALLLAVGLAVSVSNAKALNPERPYVGDVVNVLNKDINTFWWKAFGTGYRAPTQLVWYRPSMLPLQTGCGVISQANNSFYCGNDEKIYFEYDFNQNLIAQYRGLDGYGTVGDYATGFIFAHEWAHHAQMLSSWLKWAVDRHYYAGRELQADCYAGIYTRDAWNRGVLNNSDIFEARALLRNIGDSPGTSYYDQNAHGSGAQRVAMFDRGLYQQSYQACNTIYTSLYGMSAAGAKAKAKSVKTKRGFVKIGPPTRVSIPTS
jgi:predicted metalloprotease